jgi:hypothetical protein
VALQVKILLVAGLAALALAPPAAAAASPGASVRVEGTAETLVHADVSLDGPAVVKHGDPAHSCKGASAAGGLERATAGDWSGTWFDGLGYAVDTIKGESHTAATSAYWAYWVNYRPSTRGVCDTTLQQGDEHLLFPDCWGAGCVNPTVLRLIAPRRVGPGAAYAVDVKRVVVTYDPATWEEQVVEEPAGGVTVRAGGASATTDDQGTATLPGRGRGEVVVSASGAAYVRDADTVCVTDGADGFCGTTKPGEPPRSDPQPPCETDGADGRCGTADRRPPVGRIAGISHGREFKRKRAPRLLRGSVDPDPSGLEAVELRLTRRHKGRCWGYSGRRDRFVRTTCGKTWRFNVGDRGDWSYLLPRRLGPGRYKVAVRARDRAMNLDPIDIGRNWVAFRVR